MTTDKNMRNRPAQGRSEDTVDVILEATAQVLDNSREVPVTTNHIAQRAGVSIGSLYRYFTDKQGILAVLVRREAERQEDLISQIIDDWSGSDGRDLIRQIAGISVDGFHGRKLVRRSLLKHLNEKDKIARELHAVRYRILLRLEDKLVAQHPDVYRALSDDERHAMLGAWIGSINAVLIYSRHDFEADALKDQLVDLVSGYLRKGDRTHC
jgi:AcrR family transcriptional regulator